jgi:hypothetical protein
VLDSINGQVPSPEPAAERKTPAAGEVAPPSVSINSEDPGEDRHWWSRFLHTRGHQPDLADDSPPDETNGHEPIAPVDKLLTLSEEELNQRIEREAQSRHDRDIARRNREAAQAERARLRDENPEAYVELEKSEEQATQMRQAQAGQLMQLLGHVGRQHDAVSIDPIVNALPERERERILSMPEAGQGLPGRKLIVEEAMKTYGRMEYERGVRETQAKLKKDPVFRKSVLADLRGSYQEPELLPGSGSATNGGLDEDNVSTRLRRAYQQR